MTHHFKEEEMKSVGELSQKCAQIVLKFLYLARIGRPDIFWSVNKLARSITKWTKACDKRLNRLISCIHYTSTNTIVVWKTLQNNADWDCFKTPILQEILRTRNLLQVKSRAFSGVVTRSCQEVGCARNRLQFLAHPTEAQIISLDAGLRMDGIPALDLWNLFLRCFIATKTNRVKPWIHQHRETCGIASCRAHKRRIKPKLQPSTTVKKCFTLIVCF